MFPSRLLGVTSLTGPLAERQRSFFWSRERLTMMAARMTVRVTTRA